MKLQPPPKIDPCRAPLWAKSGHLQTVLGHLLPSPSTKLGYTSLRIKLEDGDVLAARLFDQPGRNVVYLFHGLGGSATSDYMLRAADVFFAAGFKVVAVNHRGCGDGENLAAQPYHSGRGEDVSAVIAHGRQLWPDHFHLAVGYSLGGNALLTLLTGLRGRVLPDAAVAVNAPINLAGASKRVHQGFNRVYECRFVLRCREAVRQRRRSGLIPKQPPIRPWFSLRRLDENYTAPEGGFHDSDHYYKVCSTYKVLDKITTPTVLLTAKDDPFIDYRDYLHAKLSAHVHLHLENQGGHVGYLHGYKNGLGYQRWLEKTLQTYALWLKDHFRLQYNRAV